MMDARPLFIVNPAAGGGRGRRAQARISALPGRNAELAVTRRPGDAEVLATEGAAAGFDPIVAVGGDGTVHEVVNGLLAGGATPPRLAMVPIGTGNDFARSVGVPRGFTEALAVATDGAGRVRTIDAARCGDRYFVVLAATGFAARVASAVNRAPSWSKIGTLPFVYHTLREVIANRNVELSVELDGGPPCTSPRS